MGQFFDLVIQFITQLWDKLGTVKFSAYGVDVPLTALIVAFLVTGMVINVFWKGAKT